MGAPITLTTAGESHGPAVTAIVAGIPAGVCVTAEAIARDMRRRQVGYGRGGRMRLESDRVEITGGIRHGLTLGSPVCLVVANRDWANWSDEMSPGEPAPGWSSERRVTVPRPGHADLSAGAKFGHADMRNVLERASARETAGRVAGGVVCRLLLAEIGVSIFSRTISIGGVTADCKPPGEEDWGAVEDSDLRCADAGACELMHDRIDAAKAAGDSVGGVVEVVVFGAPPGLGSHVAWDERLDGRLAQALMSVQAIKGVEIGAGFASAQLPGSEVHDPIEWDGSDGWGFTRPSNNAGGIEGGVTNGEPILARLAMKPIPTLTKPLASVDTSSGEAVQAHAERSDVCAVPAAGVVAEAMVALTLASAALEKFGGDTVDDMKAARDAYMRRLGLPWSGGRTDDAEA